MNNNGQLGIVAKSKGNVDWALEEEFLSYSDSELIVIYRQ